MRQLSIEYVLLHLSITNEGVSQGSQSSILDCAYRTFLLIHNTAGLVYHRA
jgi:hypothetical protein